MTTKPAKAGPMDAYLLPDLIVLLRKEAPSGGTDGSVIGHVGLKVKDMKVTLEKCRAAGVKIESGEKPGKRGNFEAADIPGANLTFAAAEKPVVPTKGRALDHIGFEIKGLEAFCKQLEARGVKLDTPYTKRPDLGIARSSTSSALQV